MKVFAFLMLLLVFISACSPIYIDRMPKHFSTRMHAHLDYERSWPYCAPTFHVHFSAQEHVINFSTCRIDLSFFTSIEAARINENPAGVETLLIDAIELFNDNQPIRKSIKDKRQYWSSTDILVVNLTTQNQALQYTDTLEIKHFFLKPSQSIALKLHLHETVPTAEKYRFERFRKKYYIN